MPYDAKNTAILIDAAYKAGFRGDALVNAVATAQAESSSFSAHNQRGEDSRGSWQINVAPNANPKYATWNLFDPYVNARAAFEISGGGKNWNPWSVWHMSAGAPAIKYLEPTRRILGTGGQSVPETDDIGSAVAAALASLSGGVGATGAGGLDFSSLLGDDTSGQLSTTLDLLDFLQSRRTKPGTGEPSIANLLGSLYPSSMEYNPGFNPGGLADILMGIISGKGTALASGLLPNEVRKANIIDPKSLVGKPAEPVEGEAGNLEATLLNQLMRMAQEANLVPSITPPSLAGGAGTAGQGAAAAPASTPPPAPGQGAFQPVVGNTARAWPFQPVVGPARYG